VKSGSAGMGKKKRRGGRKGRPVSDHAVAWAATSGWAWSVSSPDSPVRIR
jgi:hypothetical protein